MKPTASANFAVRMGIITDQRYLILSEYSSRTNKAVTVSSYNGLMLCEGQDLSEADMINHLTWLDNQDAMETNRLERDIQ